MSEEPLQMQHPYEPSTLVLEGFQPIVLSSTTILGVFFFVWTTLLFIFIPFLKYGQKLSTRDTTVCCWLLLSAVTHIFTEGPVVINADFYKNASGDFMCELWKEYAKADARYATRDPCTIGIEAITAFVEGPLCLLLIVAFIRRFKWRYIMTAVTVTGQLYGCALYFLTSYFEGFVYQRKEPLYFWFYFVTMNGIWIICPILVIWAMLKNVNEAMDEAQNNSRKKK